MRKAHTYTTVHNTNMDEFDKEIDDYLEAGFELHGNPYCGNENGGLIVFQAMVKYEELI